MCIRVCICMPLCCVYVCGACMICMVCVYMYLCGVCTHCYAVCICMCTCTKVNGVRMHACVHINDIYECVHVKGR